MGTPSYLTTSVLTRVQNNIESPFGFLKRLIFPVERTFAAETLELSSYERGRQVAPFVRRGAEGVFTQGYEKKFAEVTAPYIRIKRPINPWEGMNERLPGQGLFPSEAERRAARRAHVAREQQGMEDDIVNAEEWLAAMAIRGEITYSVADGEHFTITFPKPAGNTTSAAASWGTSSTDPMVDFKAAKRLVAAAHPELSITHCIMSQGASDKFTALSKVRELLDTKNVAAGNLDFTQQYREQGTLIYLGSYAGIPCWEYNAELTVGGVATPLIRDDYVEFVCASRQADNAFHYAAIADEEAPDGLFVGKRFAKSWKEPDPSGRVILAASRPLPVVRKPGGFVSIDVS